MLACKRYCAQNSTYRYYFIEQLVISKLIFRTPPAISDINEVEIFFNSLITYIKIYNQKAKKIFTIFPILPSLLCSPNSLQLLFFFISFYSLISYTQVWKALSILPLQGTLQQPYPSPSRDPCEGLNWSYYVSFHICCRLPWSTSVILSHWGLNPQEAALPKYDVTS